MFTGIIEAVGEIRSTEQCGGDLRLVVGTAGLELADVRPGDSIAVNGACLTAVEIGDDWFAADVSRETLECTTLGDLAAGAPVNLEKALLANQRLGGHFVSGHVDGIGEVVERSEDARSVRFGFAVPMSLLRYIATKGSICIDGTSLTVNEVGGERFGVNIVPHTLRNTIFEHYRPGVRVNLEVDLLARYLERLRQFEKATERGPQSSPGVSMDLLRARGFVE